MPNEPRDPHDAVATLQGRENRPGQSCRFWVASRLIYRLLPASGVADVFWYCLRGSG